MKHRNKKTLQRIAKLAIALCCLLSITFSSLPLTAFATTEPRVVRVGYYENEVFQEGAGEGLVKTGYAYEYYQKISEYTGWKYEYIYGGFGDLYQMLLDGEIDLLENIGNRADVILVSVGDEKTPQAVVVLHQVADVGDDAVDAVHIIAGKCHTAVHHDDLAAILIHGHILADLVKTAKRDDFQFFCHDLLLFQCKNGRILAHWGEKCIAKQRRSA